MGRAVANPVERAHHERDSGIGNFAVRKLAVQPAGSTAHGPNRCLGNRGLGGLELCAIAVIDHSPGTGFEHTATAGNEHHPGGQLDVLASGVPENRPIVRSGNQRHCCPELDPSVSPDDVSNQPPERKPGQSAGNTRPGCVEQLAVARFEHPTNDAIDGWSIDDHVLQPSGAIVAGTVECFDNGPSGVAQARPSQRLQHRTNCRPGQ